MLSIRVKTKDFLRAIKIVENAIEDDKTDSKNTGIYIETIENKLLFKGIGFNLFIKCECPATITSEGNIIIKYKLIEEFLRKIDEEEVEIKEFDTSVNIIAKGSNASYNLIKYQKPVELSMLHGVEYLFDKKELSDSIESTIFAASTDISKLTINCLKFDIEENILKVVSTDSFRMMYREIDILENKTNENISVNIPLKTSQGLLKIFKETDADKVLLKSDGTKVLFELDDIQIITKVIELQFPDYTNILKNVKTDKIIKLSKNLLQKKLDLVYLFVKDKKERKDVAEFLFGKNELEIIGFNDTAKTEQKITISKDSDESLKIYLNVKFILEYLNTIKKSEILEIKLSNEISAILLKEDDENNNDIYLTMPLKV
ncbi:DNA polymerase III subunit beta [Oceanivirga salmonicida]|uniref:DNA polymerase III subunit beta n=1 Tax=Oceanivirga salmonicida TaxID=1769291 RepID=UPI000836FCD0|nr:DNA polymerase III subunit beta [Oceanivirga salmonicida]